MWRRFNATLVRGRAQKEQVVLVWVTAALDGKPEVELDLEDLAKSCSMRIESLVETMDKLMRERVIFYEPTPTGIRVSLAPMLPVQESQTHKPKFALAPYLATWKHFTNGYFDPNRWARKFAAEERRVGADRLRAALETYLQSTPPKFASPRAFFDRLNALLADSQQTQPQYDQDLVMGTKQW